MRTLGVLCLRGRRGRFDASASLALHVTLPQVPPGYAPPALGGWEPNERGRWVPARSLCHVFEHSTFCVIGLSQTAESGLRHNSKQGVRHNSKQGVQHGSRHASSCATYTLLPLCYGRGHAPPTWRLRWT